MAQMLTEADVKRLIADPSGETRAETAAKVASAFETGGLSDAERGLAEQIFRVLARDAEVKVRAALSSHLKASDQLPHDVAMQMAKDVEQVSLPVLEFSKVLSDEDLVAIVRSAGAEKQTAVANRATVSGVVANALIDHGKAPTVVAALAANKGAQLGEKEVNKILERHGEHVAIGQRIGSMGSTGRSTATHLHYEVWFRGRAVDPVNFLRAGRHVHEQG